MFYVSTHILYSDKVVCTNVCSFNRMGQFKGEGERSEGYGGKWWKSAAAVAAAAGYHTVSGAADDTNTTAAKYNKGNYLDLVQSTHSHL